MIFLSPQMFLFFTIYLFFIFFMLCVDSYFIFWSIMEFSTLVFMGLSYSALKNSFSHLLIFFIIQSYSAFMLLIFFCLDSSIGFTFSIILKLSMFPFYFWYLNIVSFFSNFLFLFSSTFFKIPSILMVYNFFYILDYKLLFISIVITIIVGSVSMMMSNDMRFILISSSVINNSWFIMSQMTSLFIFFLYFFFYLFTLLMLLYFIRFNTSTNALSYTSFTNKNVVLLCFFTMAGLPPFPIFYTKMFIIYNMMSHLESTMLIISTMFVSVLTLVGYLKYVFNTLMYSFSNMVFCSFCK